MDIKIYLLRHPCFFADGTEVFRELNTKSAALLFFLAANRGRVYSRDTLAEIFWPEQTAEKARSNLRQTLSVIKKACITEIGGEESIVLSSKGDCVLNEAFRIWVDSGTFYEKVERAFENDEPGDEASPKKMELLQSALELYHTGFLQDFYVKGSAALDEWIMFERDRLDRTLTTAGRQLAQLYEEAGRLEEAIACLSRLLQSNPLQEEIYRELMRLHYRNKDRCKAVAQYKQCVKMLRKELNVGPMEETRQLYDRIMYESGALSEEGADAAGGVSEESGGMLTYRNHVLLSEDSGEAEHMIRRLCKAKAVDGPPKMAGGAVQRSEECAENVCRIYPNPFGNAEYEGFYPLAEYLTRDLLQEEENRALLSGLAPLLPQVEPLSGEGKDVRLCYTIKLLLEKRAAESGVCILLFGCYEELDGKTKELIRFLLGTVDIPSIHLIVTYRRPDLALDLRKSFEGVQ